MQKNFKNKDTVDIFQSIFFVNFCFSAEKVDIWKYNPLALAIKRVMILIFQQPKQYLFRKCLKLGSISFNKKY